LPLNDKTTLQVATSGTGRSRKLY